MPTGKCTTVKFKGGGKVERRLSERERGDRRETGEGPLEEKEADPSGHFCLGSQYGTD